MRIYGIKWIDTKEVRTLLSNFLIGGMSDELDTRIADKLVSFHYRPQRRLIR